MKGKTILVDSVRAACLVGVCLAFGLDGLQAQPNSSNPRQEAEDTVLRQLEELRNMIRALQVEVSELRRAVDDIHRVAVRPRVPPAPSTVDLDDDGMGSLEAKVAIVEFSDFQCPYCRRFHEQTFPQIEETYIETGRVRYFFRDFPLEQIHHEAVAAAVAAKCSGRQNKYWEMHHALFSQQGRLGPELFAELARDLGLDLEAFQTCMGDPAREEEVMEDLAFGQSIGVRGTPHFLVGRIEEGRLVDVKSVSGAQPFASFQSLIESLLR